MPAPTLQNPEKASPARRLDALWCAALLAAAVLAVAGLVWIATAPRTGAAGEVAPGRLLAELRVLGASASSLLLLARPYLYYGHLHVLFLVAVMVVSAFCLGRRFTQGLSRFLLGEAGAPPVSGLPRLVIDIALGFWLQSLAMFLFLALHWGRAVLTAAVVLLLVGPIVLLERQLAEAFAEIHQWRRKRRREARWGRIRWTDGALLLVTVICVALSGIMALAPPHQTDALRYHLSVPDQWMRNGGFLYLPNVAFSNFPFLVEMLFAVPLAFPDWLGLDSATRLLHWVWLVLAWGAVHGAAYRCTGRRAGRAAAALLVSTPFMPILASWAFVEVALACAILLLFACLQRWTDAEHADERRWWLVCAALFGGVSLSMKYTSAIPVAWCALWVLVQGRGRGVQQRILEALSMGAIALAAAAPWFVKSYYYTGNPVYPLANALFQAPDWTPREASLYLGHAQLKGDLWQVPLWSWPERIRDLITLPFRLTTADEHFGRWPVGLGWLGLLPLALCLGRGRDRASTFGAGAFVLFLAWAYTYRDNRFLLPCLALLAVPIGASLGRPEPGSLARAVGGALLAVVVAANLITGGAAALGPPARDGSPNPNNVLPVVTGAMTRDAFLSQPQIADYYPVLRKLGTMREQITGEVLIVGQELSYYCPVTYVCSDFFNTPVLVRLCKEVDEPEAVRDRLRQMNITHLFVNHRRLADDGPGGWRWLHDLHFLPDKQPISLGTYAAYNGRTAHPSYVDSRDKILDFLSTSPALRLHDRFLTERQFLERLAGDENFAIYALK